MSENRFRWGDTPKNRQEEFTRLLTAPAFKDVFNEKFIESLERRKSYLAGRSDKVQIVQLTVMLLLSMALLSVHSNISFLGLSTANSRDLREMLLVIGASVQFLNTFSVAEQTYIRDWLSAYATKMARGDEAAYRALRARFGLGANLVTIPRFEQGRPTAGQVIVLLMGGIGIIGWLLMTVVFTMIVQVAALIDIARDPTMSLKISTFVILYVLLVDAASFGTLIMSGAFGTRLTELEKK